VAHTIAIDARKVHDCGIGTGIEIAAPVSVPCNRGAI